MLRKEQKLGLASELELFSRGLQAYLPDGPLDIFWESLLCENPLMREWGFSPWSCDKLVGLTRRVTFVKGALLGEVARYYAEDTVIWHCGSDADREFLWSTLKPKRDVQSQRFLFLLKKGASFSRIRSFFWGLGGFAEFHAFHPGDLPCKRVIDLQGIILMAAKNKINSK